MWDHFHAAVARTLAGAVVALLLGVSAGANGVDPRFVPIGELTGLGADWVSFDVDRVAFGQGTQVRIAGVAPFPTLLGGFELERPVLTAELIEGDLYFRTDEGLFVRPVDESGPSRLLTLLPRPTSPLRRRCRAIPSARASSARSISSGRLRSSP